MALQTRVGAILILVVLCVFGGRVWADEPAAKTSADGKAAESQDNEPSSLGPGVLDRVFRELPFAQDAKALLATLDVRFQEQLKPVLRATLDAAERDTLKEKMVKTYEAFKASWIAFEGQETGYAVSVIADEFRHNTGEGLYKYAYGNSVAYFFFSNGKLWKVFLCLETEGPFTEYVRKLVELYGNPKEVKWADEEKTKPNELMWEDDTFVFTARPPVDIFVCNRLSWEYKPMLTAVTAARKPSEEKQKDELDGDFFLNEVSGFDTDEDSNNIVDDVIRDKQRGK